jgi:hypothetical protein
MLQEEPFQCSVKVAMLGVLFTETPTAHTSLAEIADTAFSVFALD